MFKGECAFSTWLYRIGYNTALSAMRKRQITFPVLDEKLLENISENDVDIFFEDHNEKKIKKLEYAMKCLSVEERTLIILYYMEDKSITEIAPIVHLTSENIKVKLFRIRKKLFVLMTASYEKR